MNYNGPFMMVMAFYHAPNDPTVANDFKPNWPSPIVFHDSFDYRRDGSVQPDGNFTLTADKDNIHVLDFREMRVFNSPMYSAYEHYRNSMPDFTSLHNVRKPTGTAIVEG